MLGVCKREGHLCSDFQRIYLAKSLKTPALTSLRCSGQFAWGSKTLVLISECGLVEFACKLFFSQTRWRSVQTAAALIQVFVFLSLQRCGDSETQGGLSACLSAFLSRECSAFLTNKAACKCSSSRSWCICELQSLLYLFSVVSARSHEPLMSLTALSVFI